MTRRRRLPPNVTCFVDRHGKERCRYRKTGQPTYYFRHPLGTKEFKAELDMCKSATLQVANDRTIPGSIDDLCARYYRSPGFLSAGPDTQRVSRGILELFRAEFGKDRVENFNFEHIEAILVAKSKKRQEGKRMVGGPTAAKNLRKQLMRLFALAVRVKMIAVNPVADAEKLKVPKTGGFHTWTEEEIAQYQKRHPLGTKARLALEIFLWTGQRRGDASTFGRRHLRGGKMKYKQEKTGKELWLPAAPQLLEAITSMPAVGLETFLVTDYGKPFSKAGLGNKMREWCDQAGLPQCSAHGLRKAIARRMAEIGAGNQGIKAVGGWSGDAEVATYTAAVDQARLAEATLNQLSAWDLANRSKENLANPSSSD